ncbi:MAG: amidohydrolase [Gemmatimonadaceae bacterium]
MKRLSRSLLPLALVLLPAAALAQARADADLIVTAARIYTVDPTRPMVEAIASRGSAIVFAGSRAQVMALKGAATRVVDYPGATIIPGMTDAHGHLSGLGQALRTVDLVGTKSYDEVIARVVERAKTAKPGEWITGRGWDQNHWADTRFPTHGALSRATPGNPVYLTRVDGHAALANAKAMQAASVGASTADPSGGRLIRGTGAEPTGVFVDNAQHLVDRVIPPPSRDDRRAAVLAAIAECNRWGLTALHDAGESRGTIDLFEELAKAGNYNLRNYVMVSDDSAALSYYFARGIEQSLYDGRLWIRSVKLYMDGALGSRGAALLEPYADDPGNSGLLVSTPQHIRDVAVRALRAGFQVNTHAIGDRGNRLVLDAYESALKEVPTAEHRFRIEHAQIIHHDDIPRFAKLGVIPSMQASHQTSDMYWAVNRLGPSRLLGAYAWRSLLETGVVIPNGSDFPVESVNPLISFHAAVSRRDADNWPAGGWFPEQAMTREEALKAMTIWPAYAAFAEQQMGSLTPGKVMDFVVLDHDIMKMPAEYILGTTVVATWLGGKAVYEKR